MGEAFITASDINDNSTDNCGTPNLSIDISTFDCSLLGANTVLFTAIDASGNTDTCHAIVTVEENESSNVCGIEPCTQNIIDLDMTLLMNDPHQSEFIAIQKITSDGTVTSINMEQLLFMARESVELFPNFTVELGAELTVVIDECSTSLTGEDKEVNDKSFFLLGYVLQY